MSSIKDIRFSLFPMLCIILTDILLSFIKGYALIGTWMIYTYPVYLINAAIARLLIKNVNQYTRIMSTVMLSSVIFFILTNLGVFLMDNE